MVASAAVASVPTTVQLAPSSDTSTVYAVGPRWPRGIMVTEPIAIGMPKSTASHSGFAGSGPCPAVVPEDTQNVLPELSNANRGGCVPWLELADASGNGASGFERFLARSVEKFNV